MLIFYFCTFMMLVYSINAASDAELNLYISSLLAIQSNIKAAAFSLRDLSANAVVSANALSLAPDAAHSTLEAAALNQGAIIAAFVGNSTLSSRPQGWTCLNLNKSIQQDYQTRMTEMNKTVTAIPANRSPSCSRNSQIYNSAAFVTASLHNLNNEINICPTTTTTIGKAPGNSTTTGVTSVTSSGTNSLTNSGSTIGSTSTTNSGTTSVINPGTTSATNSGATSVTNPGTNLLTNSGQNNGSTSTTNWGATSPTNPGTTSATNWGAISVTNPGTTSVATSGSTLGLTSGTTSVTTSGSTSGTTSVTTTSQTNAGTTSGTSWGVITATDWEITNSTSSTPNLQTADTSLTTSTSGTNTQGSSENTPTSSTGVISGSNSISSSTSPTGVISGNTSPSATAGSTSSSSSTSTSSIGITSPTSFGTPTVNLSPSGNASTATSSQGGSGTTIPTTITSSTGTISQISPVIVMFNSNTSPQVGNYIGNPPVSNQNYQYCDVNEPYFNGQACISCASPLYFDFNTNLCTSCSSPGSSFSAVAKQCSLDPHNILYYTTTLTTTNYMGTIPNSPFVPSGKVLQTCPSTAPFYNGNICVACSLPNFFNFNTNLCQTCANGLQFDMVSRRCISLIPRSSRMNSYVVGKFNFVGQVPAVDSQLKTCPQDKPFFSSNSCISCKLPQYFDFSDSTCKGCPIGLVFNTNNRMCEYSPGCCVTNLSSSNIFYDGDYSALIAATQAKLTANPQIKICPDTTPYFDATSNKCIGCGDGVFNEFYNRCMTCDESTEVFDQETHICLSSARVPASLERMMINTYDIFG